jgi:hypothetical protein
MKTTSFILPKYIYELLKEISEEGVKGRESLTIKLPEAYIEVMKKNPLFITMGEFIRFAILMYLMERKFRTCKCRVEYEEFTEDIPPF